MSEQLKFENDMKEWTGKPAINSKSKNIKRTVGDLYQWQQKCNSKTEKQRERQINESERQLRDIQSVKLINPNSEKLVSRVRNENEPIEQKLLRDGERNKLKTQQRKEEYFKLSVMSEPTCNKSDYKKILYPKNEVFEVDMLDLDMISQIKSRQQIISKHFSSYRNQRYHEWELTKPWLD